MTTNELIKDAERYLKQERLNPFEVEMLEALRTLQKRNDELEAKLSAIRQAVDVANRSGSWYYPDCVLIFKADWKAIISAVEDAPVCKESLPPVDSEPAQPWTQEQMDEWAKKQRPAPKELQTEIDAAAQQPASKPEDGDMLKAREL